MRAFNTMSNEAETFRLAKSNAVQRRIIRMHALLSVVLMGVIVGPVGLVGWINQSYIKEQWNRYRIVQRLVTWQN